MAKHMLWHDEYWLLLMQLYLKRPQGVKSLYSRGLVNLAMELHIHPKDLHQQMTKLQQIDTPRIQMMWDTYARRPKKLAREVDLLRQMSGFGNSDAFYDGVEVSESWEKDFKPVDGMAGADVLTPVMLIMILDLYFRLVPNTMIPQTPEIIALAELMGTKPETITDIMEVFRFCDPLLSREDIMIHPMLTPCMQIWKRFGNEPSEKLSALADQLKMYWK